MDSGTLVRIDGAVDTIDANEMDAICGSAAEPVALDLSDPKLLDSAGEACLRRFVDSGAIVDAAAPYIQVDWGFPIDECETSPVI